MHRYAMHSSDHSPRILMACIGDASRFRLVQALLGGARCVTDLASEVGLSQSCTTRHLQALERRSVVCGARDGKRVLYRLCHEQPALGPLLAWALTPEGASAAKGLPAEPTTTRTTPSGSTRRAKPVSRRASLTGARTPARRSPGRVPPPPARLEPVVPGPSPGAGAGSADAERPESHRDAGNAPREAQPGTLVSEPIPDPPRRRRSEIEDYLL